MRLYKQIILPIELVDYIGRIVLKAYEKDKYKSILKWKIEFQKIKKPQVIEVKMQ